MPPKSTACPKCRTPLDISGFKPGQRIRCSVCSTVLRIPEPVAVAPAAAPPIPVAPATQKISLQPGAGARSSAGAAPAPRATAQTSTAAMPAREEKKDELVGFVVADQFEIVRKLGEGGYGAVYEAMDRTLHRRVAIKLMLAVRASNKEYVEKFRREAQTAAKISHPNVVALHAFGPEPKLKTHYLAMEFAEGVTLHDVLQERGPLDQPEAVDIISQCCRGLAVAHRMHIIHRDIKPGNIMITPHQGVKIADFGLAKQLDADEQAKSMVIGTPFFMPPEQFEGKAKDGRTDIYALGVTLYYMLTMKRPFTGSTPAQILVGIMTKEPTPVTEYRPELSEALWAVVRKMIHRDLDQRYQDCDEILADLAKLRSPDQGDKIFCPECGVPNEADATKCRGCNGSMRERCPVCGAEEDVGTKFCGDCGANIPLEREVKGLSAEGKELLARGEFLKAIDKLHEAKEKSPDNSEVVSLLREAENRRDGLDRERTTVSSLIAAGDFDRAEQRLNAALESYPGEERLLTLKNDLERTRVAMRKGQGKFTVEALLKSHRYADAREAAERLMISEGRSPELLELLGKAEAAIQSAADRTAKARELDASGQATGAFQAWKEVLQVNPSSTEAQQRVRDLEAAKGAADALLQQAGAALDGGDPDAAAAALAGAADGIAGDPRVKELAGKAKSAAADLRKGAEAVRRLAADEDADGAAKALADLSKRFPKASAIPGLEEEVRAARRAATSKVRLEKARSLAKAKKWAEARDAASEVLSDDPQNEKALEIADKAKSELARAADLLSRATAAEQAGKIAAAEEAFLEATEAAPGDAEAAEGLRRVSEARKKVESLKKEAKAAIAAKDPARAADLYRKVLEAVPHEAEATAEMKRLEELVAGRLRDFREVEELLAAGEVEDAMERARALDRKYPGDAEAAEVTGIAERLLGSRDAILARVERLLGQPGRDREAAKLAQVALRILPGDPRAAGLLAKAKNAGKDQTL